jgi:hypothetical protein
MKQIIVTLIFGLSSVSATHAGESATKMLDATYKLFHPGSTGTCILVRREPPDQSLYVVTANHVLERTKGATAIIVLRERLADGFYQRRLTAHSREAEKEEQEMIPL